MNVTAFKRRKEFGKTLASDIAHRMRNEIVTCRLKPGEVLKFDTLRLAYGASFTTLREALTCLAAEGLVVAEEQRGFKVAPISLADLIDLTRARILIEVDLIRRSIENGDDDWEIAVISSIHRLGIIEGARRRRLRRQSRMEGRRTGNFTNPWSAAAARRPCSVSGNRCSNAPSAIAISRHGCGHGRATRPASTAR